jgi:adenine-specific DNA-methyltransferase
MSKSTLLEKINQSEEVFKKTANPERRKEYGQFFTPPVVARWMAKWVTVNHPKNILEPSVGLGSLAGAVLVEMPNAYIEGIEKDSEIFDQISPELASKITLRNINYFDLEKDQKYDGIIANPPYVRHHSLDIEKETYSALEDITGEKLSKLTNLYVLFCIDIIDRLTDGGRAAIIIPTEWMNANFGAGFKKYLNKVSVLKSVIYVSHDALIFDDALTTAAILLLEKGSGISKDDPIDFVFVLEKEFFDNTTPLKCDDGIGSINFQYGWDELLNTKKWDSLFNKDKLIGNQENLIRLENLCTSRRGIATGANFFFHLSKSEVKKNSLSQLSLKKCIGSAPDVKGLIFTSSDFEALVERDGKSYLFDPPPSLSESDAKYIESGISLEVDKGYLTSNRKVWYSQERRSPALIWVGVFNREKVKFIYNESEIYNLTTFHCLYPHKEFGQLQVKALVAILNHQDFAAYVMEQRRVYGGGLVKLEPKDLNDIRVPDLRLIPLDAIKALAKELDEADKSMKEGNDYKFKFDISVVLDMKPSVALSSMIQQELI